MIHETFIINAILLFLCPRKARGENEDCIKMKTMTHKLSLLTAMMISLTMMMAGDMNGQNKENSKLKPLTFKERVYDFGSFSKSEGAKQCTFEFKNETDTAVIIYDIKVSCECTKAEWPKKPIKPGESGTIKVTYTNGGEPHYFDKGLNVYMSSWTKPVLLRIKGTVTE